VLFCLFLTIAHGSAANDSALLIGILLGGLLTLAVPIGTVILLRKTFKHLAGRRARTSLSWRLAAVHLVLGGLLLLTALVFQHSYVLFIWLGGGALMLLLAAALIRQPRNHTSSSSSADDTAE
jgi:hypothetical protein